MGSSRLEGQQQDVQAGEETEMSMTIEGEQHRDS